MVYQEIEDLKEISSRLAERAGEIGEKLKEVDSFIGNRFMKNYNPEKVKIEVEDSCITVWNDSIDDCICFVPKEDISENNVDDCPEDVLWNDDELDSYIIKVKKYYDDRKKSIENHEYERYLELKKKFEK